MQQPTIHNLNVHNFSIVKNRIFAFVPQIKTQGLALYVALLAHTNMQRRTVWPGQKRLARLTGMHTETVAKFLRVLEAAGLVSVQRRKRKNGGNSTSAYIIHNIDDLPLPAAAYDEQAEMFDVAELVPEEDLDAAEADPHSTPSSGVLDDTEGGHSTTPGASEAEGMPMPEADPAEADNTSVSADAETATAACEVDVDLEDGDVCESAMTSILPPLSVIDGRTPEALAADGDDRWPSGESYEPQLRDCLHREAYLKFPGFCRWFANYPKHRQVGRWEALKAWKKHRLEPHTELMIERVDACKQTPDWRRDGGRFIPHPTTWLNQRLDDEPETVDNAGKTREDEMRDAVRRFREQQQAASG